MKSLPSFINLERYMVLNALRYAFNNDIYKPINLRHILEIISKRKKQPPFFVQIGSFDGVSNDPINEFVRKYYWQGILVEPMPSFFEQLKLNYANLSGLLLENVGVGD